MSLLIRSGLYSTGAIGLHVLINSLLPDLMNNKLETIIIISLTPYVISILPRILGLDEIMKVGMIPLVSLLMMVGLTFGVMTLVKEMKEAGGSDFLSRFLNRGEDVEIFKGVRLNREFAVTLGLVVVLDLMIQFLYMKRLRTKDNNQVQRNVEKGLEKFYMKHSTCLAMPKKKA
jgi:hypothetical protein